MLLRYIEYNRLYHNPSAGITCAAFSPCGKYLATGALSGDTCIWSVAEGRLLHIFSGTIPVLSLTWGAGGGNEVICGLKDGTISCLMITQSDLQVIGFWAHSYPVECLSTTHGLLASGAHEEVRIWGQRSKEWYQDTELPLPSKTSYNRSLDVIVTSLHWIVQSTGKVQLVVTYLNHGVHIFDAMNWEHIRSVPIPGQIADSSVSADGKLIAISNVISGFDVYSLESDTALSAFGHTVTEYRKIPVLFIHNAAVLVGGNLQGDVHLWDVSSGRKLHSLIHAKGDQIFALAGFYDVEHDIFLIATGILRGSSGASVILWKAEESNNSDEAPQGVRWFRADWIRHAVILASICFCMLSVLVLILLSDARM